LRVLHIIARFNLGGTATWISNLSTGLKSAGHEVLLITGDVGRDEIEDPRVGGINTIRIKSWGRKLSVFQDVRAFLRIRKEILRLKPDVVNTHTSKAGVLGRLANASLFSRRSPLVHTIHGHLFAGYFPRPVVEVIAKVEKILSRLTDVMLFAGEKVRQDCINFGIDKQKSSKVVMPGVSFFSKPRIQSERITIGWLARLAKVKRPDRVLELAQRLPQFDFLIGGDGQLRSVLEAGAPLNCKFVGWIGPEEFWKSCDIALLTSDNEALPISLIEAQLSGIPCVTTPAGSATEVVLDGENGLVAKDFNVSSLADLIRKLTRDKNLRETLGNQGKKRSSEIFSPARQLSDHILAYNEAILISGKSNK